MTSQTPALARTRQIILRALQDANNGTPPRSGVAAAVREGKPLPLDSLDFDSLAIMEFCISVELNCGLELTPDLLSTMEAMSDVETWIAARLPDA